MMKIFYRINDLRYDIPRFLKNLWYFRKQLWEFRSWDFTYNLDMFARSLNMTAECLQNGNEIESSRFKKVEKIKRVVELLNNFSNCNFIEQAEKELKMEVIFHGHKFISSVERPGFYELVDERTDEEKKQNDTIFDRSTQIENEQWEELWSILKGNGGHTKDQIVDMYPEQPENNTEENINDGSDCRSWWD